MMLGSRSSQVQPMNVTINATRGTFCSTHAARFWRHSRASKACCPRVRRSPLPPRSSLSAQRTRPLRRGRPASTRTRQVRSNSAMVATRLYSATTPRAQTAALRRAWRAPILGDVTGRRHMSSARTRSRAGPTSAALRPRTSRICSRPRRRGVQRTPAEPPSIMMLLRHQRLRVLLSAPPPVAARPAAA